ncbi:hypothetical protein CGMCC3_g14539 [Colletotrichum fructicola]|nr:uncharacterized protein CGMCC3_g14539 [Colletotrichum fructicola]KAE9569389.1 hypothetical protein CGMCC3_g14539 [Colletotrichum fructicola]
MLGLSTEPHLISGWPIKVAWIVLRSLKSSKGLRVCSTQCTNLASKSHFITIMQPQISGQQDLAGFHTQLHPLADAFLRLRSRLAAAANGSRKLPRRDVCVLATAQKSCAGVNSMHVIVNV